MTRISYSVFLVLLSIETAFAWQSTTLQLQLVDQNSAPIPNVTAKLKSDDKVVKEIFQEIPKELVFTIVVSGKYVLEIEASGFRPFSREIALSAGKNELTVKLEIAEIRENIVVEQSAQEKAIDNAFSSFLTAKQIADLPDDPKELEKALKQIAGDENAIIRVDGFTAGSNLPLKSQIASIRIVRSSFDAENHELGFPYVIITTKPANIRVSGSLLFNFNDEIFNARNAFAPVRTPQQEKNTILYLLAPIKQNKTSLFLLLFDLRKVNARHINAVLPSGRINDFVNAADNYTSINTAINQNLSKSHNAKFDYDFSASNSKNLGIGGFNLAERGFDLKTLRHQLRFSESGYIGNRFLNEVRFEFQNEKSKTLPQSENVGITVLDSFSGGGAGNRQTGTKQRLMFADNLFFGWRQHALKIGTLIEFERRNSIFETNRNGRFTFSTLEDFQQNRPSIFTQNAVARRINLSQIQFGVFVQDDVKLRKKLNLSFGLRYENQSNIKDHNNFSPRIGFAWSPLKSGKLTFRGGIGVFYNWLTTSDLAVIESNGVSQPNETIIINPSFPNPFADGISEILPTNFWQIDANLQTPEIFHTSFGAEGNLSKNLIVRASYIYEKGTHQFRSRNVNAPLFGTRPNNNYGNIINIESSAFFVRNALEIGLNGSLHRNINFYINYELSRIISDSDGIFNLPSDNYNLQADRATANNERRHDFSANLSWTIKKGFRISGFYLIKSGLPYTITTGADNNDDTIFNDRPSEVARNNERGETQKQANFSLSYAFSFFKRNPNDSKAFGAISVSSEAATGFDSTDSDKRFLLKFYATAENVFNQTNFTNYIGVQSSPLFRQAVSASQARKLIFGIKLNF